MVNNLDSKDIIVCEITVPVFDAMGLREKIAAMFDSSPQSHIPVVCSPIILRAEDDSIKTSFDEALKEVLNCVQEKIPHVDLRNVNISLSIEFADDASPYILAQAKVNEHDWAAFRGCSVKPEDALVGLVIN